MASYFDHFIILPFINTYLTDGFMIVLGVIMVMMVLSYRIYLIPHRIQIIVEGIIDHWRTVVHENGGETSSFYLLPIITLFFFLLGLNGLGFFTYTFPVTTHLFITFGLALTVWIGVIFLGCQRFKSSFLSIFMPSGAPLALSPLLVGIEIASQLSRPLALGMRLAANLTAGHILMAILADFGCQLLFYTLNLATLFPLLIIMCMTILEMGVLVIQAYVFCLLTLIYLKDSLILH